MAERLGDWLSAQPFSLAMSSGFFGFYAHTGMLQTLTERIGVKPTLVTGSSAGALVGGAWSAGLPPAQLAERLLGLRRDDFWDPALGAGLLRGRKFDQLLRELLPVHAVEECPLPLAISVFDIVARKTHVLRSGDLSSAIRASCAVPGMFHPVWIGRRAYWDGGILDRSGVAGIPSGHRALTHHLLAKSPWGTELKLPRRAGMVTLVLDGLPRSGPYRIEAGHQALVVAREATKRALDMPIVDDLVRLRV